MIIGFDAREAFAEKAGKGQLALHLLFALKQIDLENSYRVFVKEPSGEKWPSNFREVVVSGSTVLWHLNAIRAAKRENVDVYFSPTSYVVPALASFPTVMIVHDTVAFLGVTEHQAKAKWVERLTLKRAVRKTRAIIAISENSKKDLVKLFPQAETKTFVVYPAQATEEVDISEEDASMKFQKLSLPESYILFVGTIEPRKNIEGILQAYALYKKSTSSPKKLVIVGKKGWFYENVFALVDELGLRDDVIFTGFVDKNVLPSVYKHASCFFFPSWYEGFGLIVLEAFAFGVPVVTSNNSSLPEVASDAAHLVDPANTEDMARALREVTENESLRASLIRKGFEQQKKFSWEKNAEETLGIIKRAYGK